MFDHYSTVGFDAFENTAIATSSELKLQLSSTMNQWLLERAFSGRLSDLLALCERGEVITTESLNKLGLSKEQTLRMLAVLAKFTSPDA